MKPLCRRNALELTDKRWVYDVSQLEETLRKALDVIEPTPELAPEPAPKPSPNPEPAAKELPWHQRWQKLTVKQWIYIGAAVVLLSALSEYYQTQQDDYEDSYPTGGYVAPANTSAVNQNANESVTGNMPQASVNQNAAANNAATLSGYWQDAEGGQYQVVQQGQQIAVQGSNPYGAVYGRGIIANNVLNMQYTINGVPYAAALTMDANGNLVGRYGSNVTGLSGNMALRRVR